jgi:hypothetical protein
MTRRSICRVLCVGAVMAGMTGCDTLRPWRRADDDRGRSSDSDDISKPGEVRSDSSKISAVDSDSNNPKPFFSNSRRWSGMSSEARDIERDLGVN